MSGLFGKNRRSTLFGSEISPFCTSPSLLQDVTMDATSTSLPNTLGLRSPMTGRSPDGKARSMRDQEEQLAALQKENFALKLRIYFLEERSGVPASSAEQKEAKLNIELKVEIESLRKELQEKQDLLYQAAKAIELMEDSHKKLQIEKEAQCEILNKRISDLQADFIKLKQIHFESKITSSRDQCVECHMASSDESCNDLQMKINELELIIAERQSSVHNHENIITTQTKQITNSQKVVDQKELEILDTKSKLLASEKQVVELKSALDQKIEQLTNLQEQMASVGHEMQSGEPVPYIRRSYVAEDTELQNLRDLLAQKDATLRKYETGQHNACRVIHNFISKNKSMAKEIEQLKKQLLEISQSGSVMSDKSNPCFPVSPQVLNTFLTPGGRSPHRVGLSDDVRKEREDEVSNNSALYEQLEALKSFYVTEMQRRDEIIVALEANLEKFGTVEGNVEQLKKRLEMKESEIAHLQEELRKRTCNLQGLVNKELWDKNREIERLEKRLGGINEKPLDQSTKKGKVANNEYALVLEENTNLRNYIVQLNEKKQFKQKEEEMQQIKSENEDLQRALNDLNRLEKESDQWQCLCSSLRERLEELAYFLDSLLNSGDTLGLLGGDRRQAIRLAVNRSLDLSRSVSLSVSAAQLSMQGDQSLIQLSSISGLLDSTASQDCRESLSVLPSCAKITFNSHYELPVHKDNQAQEIEALKLQIENLQNQLNKQNNSSALNVSNNKKITKVRLFQNVEQASESEAWSEPDRKVSMERMGLQDTICHSVSSPVRSRMSKGRTSGSSEDGSGDKDNKRLRDQIVKLETQLAEKENKLLEGQCTLLQADNKNKNEILKMVESIEAIKYDKLNAEKSLEEAISKLRTSEEKRSELERILEDMVTELAKQKETLSEDHERKYLSIQEQFKQSEKDKETALDNAKSAEVKFCTLQQKYDDMKGEYVSLKHNTQDVQERLEMANNANEDLLDQIKSLENERCLRQQQHESDIQAMEQNMKQDLQSNWVQKVQYESKVAEMKKLNDLLQQSSTKVLSYEKMEEKYTQKLSTVESDFNHQLQDMEHTVDVLRKQLIDKEEILQNLRKEVDTLTLKLSQTSTERTRISNEKLRLEQEIREIQPKEDEFNKKRGEMQLKISELERINADLHNKLVTLQTAKVNTLPMSLSRQKSDMSDYTSEEGCDTDRILVNSSPDLGIESDQGRLSSLETQTVERPMLKTIELTQSMGHDLGFEFNQASSMNPYTEKLRRLQEDNHKLRTELEKTRNTLEKALNKLLYANEKKKQVEQDICRQIHKTHGVLKQVRANLEIGTETDVKNGGIKSERKN